MTSIISLALILTSLSFISAIDVDPKGYVVYCPCMGRFGNQAEHFLGALAFTQGLDRTLILPPWVEYSFGNPRSIQVPFDKYFKVSAVAEYLKVITMEKFMRDLAPVIWKPNQRKSYCHSGRQGSVANDCNAKDGNPFGPFWDTFDIDFVGSEYHGGLGFNTHLDSVRDAWEKMFPVKDHMVLSFSGAPASFPVQEQNVGLHRYMEWSNYISDKADEFIENNMRRPFLGIHLRNGRDWTNACKHAENSNRQLFGSAQCLGYRMEHGTLTPDLCFPPEKTIIKQVKEAVKKLKADFVFVAADNDHMITQFSKAMKKVTFVKLPESEPHVDLAILGRSDHYIANCVSTFSHFATRERRSKNRTVDFWAFKQKHHDEL